MSANEKVNESVLLSFGGIIDENGKPSLPIEGYTLSTLISNDVLPQAVKGLLRMRRTARLISESNEKLGALATAIADDYYLVVISTRSIHSREKPCYIDMITTQKGKMVMKGMDEKKAGLMDMFKMDGSGKDG